MRARRVLEVSQLCEARAFRWGEGVVCWEVVGSLGRLDVQRLKVFQRCIVKVGSKLDVAGV